MNVVYLQYEGKNGLINKIFKKKYLEICCDKHRKEVSFAKNISMISKSNYSRLEHWIEECQSKGKLAFNLAELRQRFLADTEIALKRGLDRLSEKEKVVSIFKGYYIIIPPQYLSKGILPVTMFIDGLMKFLDRKYYVGLLNAAALHGASHQQPQEYFVVTEYPIMRPTQKKGLKINYISRRQLPPESLTEKMKTETGYITVSNPLLTAIDLITYEKKVGGLNRASTVISELFETIKRNDINEALINYASVSSLQRLGFVLDEVINKKEIADKILSLCKKTGVNFYLIPLKASGNNYKEHLNEKWKLMINTKIETDF
ncbi:MAG TPA: type IV toxin-antitoxin system AbiEi family antitoxin [Chitinophagales bacterium]|nr:type IV toxin-antitoxin system AbiEi family antitoxin [Chitinophagales bacterium]HRG86871.1 type IV toxin-antitoxin system AbiEi family antitoxin [Chitinophagales bacterium]